MKLRFWSLITSFSALYVYHVSAFPTKGRRPLVLWHGLGDSHSSPGMLEFASLIKDIYPGIFVHSIYIEEDLNKDRQAGFYGNVDSQIELVAGQLSAIPELKDGFDAIGLSQGGQFLRAYVERYNSPPIYNLITFGSQHMGISDIPACRPYDFLCQVARRATKGAVYSHWAQENLVQAQYFRDPTSMDVYLEANHFLTSINNEIPESRNQSYAQNLASLNKLVLVLFTEDKTVVPKESAWFGSEAEPSISHFIDQHEVPTFHDKVLIPMPLQPLYREDWIGLRKLDERGGVVFAACVGEHMQMGDCWEGLIRQYVKCSGSIVHAFTTRKSSEPQRQLIERSRDILPFNVLSRNANAHEVSVAGPSRDGLSDIDPSAADLTEDLDANDRDDEEQPTPKMTSTVSLTVPMETPAARLRALLARTPASSKSIPMPQPPSHSSDNESDFDPPTGIAQSTSSFARESLKDIFSRALRDPGNTPQKEKSTPRRNSIDASEVEACPRVERERAKYKANRKSLSDEEFENPSKSSQRSEASFKSSQAATFDILRERLTNSHTQLKDLNLSDSLYQYVDSVPDDESDTTTFLRDIDPNTTTPPAATSTPQQSLRMSLNSQYPFQSNLMEHDSEMQRAFEGFDSYEADSRQRPVSFPPSQSVVAETHQYPSQRQTQRRSESSLSHKKSQSFEGLQESIQTRRGIEELRSTSRTSSSSSALGSARHPDDPDRLREREKEWNKPKAKARAHTPDLARKPSDQRFTRSGSPMNNTVPSGSLSRRGSSASLRSFDGNSSKESSLSSQAEYRERLAELERERNIERERDWNKPYPKSSRPTSSLGLRSPNAMERTRTRSLIQLDSPGRLSPARHLQRHHSLTNSSRASSPAVSLNGSHHGKDDSEEEEIVLERERNWNAPRPKWTQHSGLPPHSPLPRPQDGRIRAESLKTPGTKRGESPVHRGQFSAQSASLLVGGSRTENNATTPARVASPLPLSKPSASSFSAHHDRSLSPPFSRHKSSTSRTQPPLAPTASAKGKGKEYDRSHASKDSALSMSQAPVPASKSGPGGYSFVRNRTPLPPIELDKETPERPSPSHRVAPSSPSPTGRPVSRSSGAVRPSSNPLESPKKPKLYSHPNTQGDLAPTINLEPPESYSEGGLSITYTNTSRLQEENIGKPFLSCLVQSLSNRIPDHEQVEAGDLSPERTPTMRTILPPAPETPEHTPIRSPSHSPRQTRATHDESRLQKALRSADTTTASAALNQTADHNLLQELSPPASPQTQSSPHRSHPALDSFLATPPRRPSFSTSKLEFQTPSPPKNLPELPGPPTSEDDTDDEAAQTPMRDLRPNLTAMKTPRPPGAWASTPAPPPRRNPEVSSSSFREMSNEQANSRPWTPIRELGVNLSSLKTPRPPGAWASTPGPPPPRESPTRAHSLSGDTDDDLDSGLATPVASLSRASSLPAQTPGPPGAWMATPAARKSILKVRFDTQGEPLENVTIASTRTDDVSVSEEGSSSRSGKTEKTEIPPRTCTPEPSTPISPTSRHFQSPSQKSHGIRVLDAFGREVVKEEAKPRAVNGTPRSKGGIRIVDAMGREVDGSDEPSPKLDSNVDEPSIALDRNEALVRVREGLADLANGLDAMDRANGGAWIDHGRLKELQDASKTARAARAHMGQALSSNNNDLMSKLEPLRASMKMSGSFISTTIDRRWTSSWILWGGLLTAQLFLIFIMYRVTVMRAKDLFLTTYYDPFYPEMHLYTSRPDTLRLSMLSSSGPSWFSIPDIFHREGWKAFSRHIWHNLSVLVWDWQQLVWETLGEGAAQSSSWPPT
ncbi:hypothetical protein D9615_002384 [Tricholomella constricta]|uniref:Palmitoyl-protein thioesterase 1 n=1 Tax=Tricholomella constricta TaxID=117010 RepID=A0A8H5HML6_9AGAR|nr:hypothetical protein D9615_002384 [Tricholomella constricta]